MNDKECEHLQTDREIACKYWWPEENEKSGLGVLTGTQIENLNL
jgi:hypothetical protein